MAESMYPKCGKCGEGTLLPFFDMGGRNMYACTKCCAKFGLLHYSNRTVKTDNISDIIGYEERNYFLFCWDEIPNNIVMNNILKNYIMNNFGVQWLNDSKIEKIDNGMTIKLYDRLLFSWDNIPGSDNSKLITFLKHIFIIFLPPVPADIKIVKSTDGKTIQMEYEKKIIGLRLNDEKTKIKITTNDGRIAEFITKLDNGKLNVYFDDNKIFLLKLNNEKNKANLIIDDRIRDELITKLENGKLNVYETP